MTPILLKTHKYVWILLVLIIPVVLFIVVKDLSFYSSEAENIVLISSQDEVIKASENEIIKASVRKDTSQNIRLELVLKTPLKNAAAVVYAVNNTNEKGVVIGQLTTTGSYSFALASPLNGILVYDTLKTELITKLDF